MKKKSRRVVFVAVAVISAAPPLLASGHGPVFGLATPTNPQGGFSLDTSFMGRYGDGGGAMFRATLGYGLTENLKISVSAPVVFETEPFMPTRGAAFTPMGGDFEGLAIWRFHRQDTGVGSRFETAAIGGLLVPGPQHAGGPAHRSWEFGGNRHGSGLPRPLRLDGRELSTLRRVGGRS